MHLSRSSLSGRLSALVILVAVALLAVVVPSDDAEAARRRRRPAFWLAEKDVNLDEALRLAAYLRERGMTVIMTREQDVFIPLGVRAALASAAGADFFLSIHNNGSYNRNQRGTELYHQIGSEQGRRLSERILNRLGGATGFPSVGVFSRPGAHGDYYFVLRRVHTVSVLVEGGYVSNPDEARALADPEVRQRMAEAIGGAVIEEVDSHIQVGPGPPQALVTLPIRAPGLPTIQVDEHGVTLSWTGTTGAGVVHGVWRNGFRVGEVKAKGPLPGGVERLTFQDPTTLQPGTHRYQVQTELTLAGMELARSEPIVVEVKRPVVVVVDPGHGGKDPGALGPR